MRTGFCREYFLRIDLPVGQSPEEAFYIHYLGFEDEAESA